MTEGQRGPLAKGKNKKTPETNLMIWRMRRSIDARFGRVGAGWFPIPTYLEQAVRLSILRKSKKPQGGYAHLLRGPSHVCYMRTNVKP